MSAFQSWFFTCSVTVEAEWQRWKAAIKLEIIGIYLVHKCSLKYAITSVLSVFLSRQREIVSSKQLVQLASTRAIQKKGYQSIPALFIDLLHNNANYLNSGESSWGKLWLSFTASYFTALFLTFASFSSFHTKIQNWIKESHDQHTTVSLINHSLSLCEIIPQFEKVHYIQYF